MVKSKTVKHTTVLGPAEIISDEESELSADGDLSMAAIQRELNEELSAAIDFEIETEQSSAVQNMELDTHRHSCDCMHDPVFDEIPICRPATVVDDDITQSNKEIINEVKANASAKISNARVRRLDRLISQKDEFLHALAKNRSKKLVCCSKKNPLPDDFIARMEDLGKVVSSMERKALANDTLSEVLELRLAYNEAYKYVENANETCESEAQVFCRDCLSWFCHDCHERLDPLCNHHISRKTDSIDMKISVWHFPGEFVPQDRTGNVDFLSRCCCSSTVVAKHLYEVIDQDYCIRDLNIRLCGNCDRGNFFRLILDLNYDH